MHHPLKQEHDGGIALVPSGEIERRRSRARLHAHVSLPCNEQLSHLEVTLTRCAMQRRVEQVGARVDGRAPIDERAHHVGVPRERRRV